MDEPLSNLDAKLRVQMRSELKRFHQDLERDHHLRHARPARGRDHGRQDGGDERRRAAAVRHAGARLRPSGEHVRRRLRRQPGDEPDRARSCRAGGAALRRRRAAGAARCRRRMRARRWRRATAAGRARRAPQHDPAAHARRRRERSPAASTPSSRPATSPTCTCSWAMRSSSSACRRTCGSRRRAGLARVRPGAAAPVRCSDRTGATAWVTVVSSIFGRRRHDRRRLACAVAHRTRGSRGAHT